jgi:hypothetical protein
VAGGAAQVIRDNSFMPLMAELGWFVGRAAYYKHGAPNGAFFDFPRDG